MSDTTEATSPAENIEALIAKAEQTEILNQPPVPGRPPLPQILEAALMGSNKPLSLDQLLNLFPESDQPDITDIQQALVTISQACKDRGFELKQVASGYRFQVKQAMAPWIGSLWEEKPQRYTRALLETLALIAYRQPITRGEIEEVRGVSVSSNIIRSLQEREWIRVVGHRDVPGRPAMFATTRLFLDYFNLQNLNELPSLSEIRDLDKAARALEHQSDILDTVESPTDTDTEEDEADAEQSAQALFAELDEIEAKLPNSFNDLIKQHKIGEQFIPSATDDKTLFDSLPEADSEQPSTRNESDSEQNTH